jgi:hypothetical protein
VSGPRAGNIRVGGPPHGRMGRGASGRCTGSAGLAWLREMGRGNGLQPRASGRPDASSIILGFGASRGADQ